MRYFLIHCECRHKKASVRASLTIQHAGFPPELEIREIIQHITKKGGRIFTVDAIAITSVFEFNNKEDYHSYRGDAEEVKSDSTD